MGGMLGNTVVFCLDVRAEYSAEEAANIKRYKLGREVIYSSQHARQHLAHAGVHMIGANIGTTGERVGSLARGVAQIALAKLHLNISIASLGRGQHIECKDLGELSDAERTVLEACRRLRDYLKMAASFNGMVILVDFEDGEKVQVAPGMVSSAEPDAASLASAALAPETVQDAEYTEVDGDAPLLEGSEDALTPDAAAVLMETIKQHYARYPRAFWIGGIAVAVLLLYVLTKSLIVALIVALLIGGIAYLVQSRG